jgi:ParB-like chromosome segregation protein Spo0J
LMWEGDIMAPLKKGMHLERFKISDLQPAEYNPRKDLQPGDIEYEKIKRSIQEFGYIDPLILNKDMTVIGGHQRLKVLQELGYTEIDCIVTDLTKDKEKALNIALNKISGEWDIPMLKDLLLDIDTGSFDISITGFDSDEIDALMTKNSNPADIEELLKELDMEQVIEKPIWATIRTDPSNQELLEKAFLILENNGIRIERSYEK